jgi:hypothetical protein
MAAQACISAGRASAITIITLMVAAALFIISAKSNIIAKLSCKALANGDNVRENVKEK